MKDVTVTTKSEQTVTTPQDFFDAVQSRFGTFRVDLAAHIFNAQCSVFLDEAQDSLKQEWYKHKGNLWLNPPFKRIEPWVKKAHLESLLGAKVFVLVPASLCTKWFKYWVEGKCMVWLLEERLKFEGHETIYPKELMLLQYDRDLRGLGFWSWKGN